MLVTNADYVCAGETVAKAVALSPEDRHLVVLPLFHGNAQCYSTTSALVTRDQLGEWHARFRDALPRTSVGKIQKHVLRAELGA